MISQDLDFLDSARCDVCIVGSGPVGSSLAVELVRKGLSVIVLESGLARPDRKIQSLSDAFLNSPSAHHLMDVAVSRSVGGTSRLWGGRCVFLDEIDFESREYVPNSGWPISFDDLAIHSARAAELLGCSDGRDAMPDWPQSGDPDIETRSLEHWVNEPRTLRCLPELTRSARLKVLLNATAVGVQLDPGSRAIIGLYVAREGRTAIFTGATFYVLAQGGVEIARFLLNVQAEHPRLFEGAKTNVGRNYMGHLSGSIASVRFFQPDTARYFASVEGPKSFARRRLTFTSNSQRLHQLPNVSFWPDNASYSDPDHGSGILSAASLVLRLPGVGPRMISEAILRNQNDGLSEVWPHFKNMVRDPHGMLNGAAEILRQRVRYGRQLPRLFVTNPKGFYPLRFHAEQYPDSQNAIQLSGERDWLGTRRAIIDFNFSTDQMSKIIDAHRILDGGLRRLGIGELVYHDSEGRLDPAEQVGHLALDGLHQIGLTRMAESASTGVVDRNCRVFDFENLFIASSSTFRTSGQAPPTLPAVALAVRLAVHIARERDRMREVASNAPLAPTLSAPTIRGRRMHILHVTASYYPAVRYGGPIYTVHSLARALVERGHRVVVYTTNVDGDQRTKIPPGGATLMDGVEVHYFPSPFARIYWSPAMIRMLNANVAEFDIVHAHGAFLYPTVAARRAASRAGVPFVYSPRGMFVWDLIKRKNLVGKALWILLFEMANVRAAVFVHATSASEAHDMRRLKLNPNTFQVIPNGVDLPSTPPDSSAESHQFLATLRPYILILGRVNWKKGIDRLIRAMSFVPSTKLAIVGNDDENYTPRLQAIARECGIGDRVVFAGPAYGKDKFDWMENAELFVLPSYSENFGVVLLEAMHCGRAVIMTPEVGIAEDIGDTGAGLVVPGDPEQLGAAINSLLLDPSRRLKMGQIGRTVAQNKYSWPAIAEQMEAAYLNCSDGRTSFEPESILRAPGFS